jgi:hypothetical protein
MNVSPNPLSILNANPVSRQRLAYVMGHVQAVGPFFVSSACEVLSCRS